jgi:hypothetical protein
MQRVVAAHSYMDIRGHGKPFGIMLILAQTVHACHSLPAALRRMLADRPATCHTGWLPSFGARKGWTLRYSTVIQSSMMVKQRLCYQRYRATFGTVLLCWMLDNIEDYRHSTPTQPNTPSPSLPPQPFCTSSLLSSPCPPALHSPEIAISFNGTVNPHSASLNTI